MSSAALSHRAPDIFYPLSEAPTAALAAEFAALCGIGIAELPDAVLRFLSDVRADLAADELPGISVRAFAAELSAFWRFGEANAAAPNPVIRLRVGPEGTTPSDVLEITQPDRPFLVDSVMAAVAEAEIGVRAMFHPVVTAAEQPRSMIQIYLDRVGEDREAGLITSVREALADVQLAVDDFHAMRQLMRRTISDLAAAPLRPGDEHRAEYVTFLNWLEGDRFVFLGARAYDYPRTPDGGYAAEEPDFKPGDSLGVLRDPDSVVLRRSDEPSVHSARGLRMLTNGAPVVVAKANLRSRVHRRVHADYVGVRRYGADGQPSGEIRFVGLFTSDAYETPARDVPLIRAKVMQVQARAGHAAGSHNAVRLRNILETWPRDELFQTTDDELLTMAGGVLHLFDRPRVKLFTRRDPFDRYVSVLMYVPRERYDTDLRVRVGQILTEAYGGWIAAFYPSFTDAPLTRVHYIVALAPGEPGNPDMAALEARVAAASRNWEDRFEDAVREAASGAAVTERLRRYQHAFPAAYRDQYDADETFSDIDVIEMMAPDEKIRIRAYQPAGVSGAFNFKLYRPGQAAPLADVLPVLNHMGLKALIQHGFELQPVGADGTPTPVWVHEFVVADAGASKLAFLDVKIAFEAAFVAIWNGQAESDGFNRLVVELGISWREAALLRALARYRQQTGLDPSQIVQEMALRDYPHVARLILDLFAVKFDPALGHGIAERRKRADAVQADITIALKAVESLDSDRVLRRLAALVGAVQRSNYYQTDRDGRRKPYISFKIESRTLADLPLPKPFREIYVSAPNVEGVHLRFGPVARGGLRWSDRRDDFRTEVLGLVKAQQVKNAVIVPVGSKGCFYPKLLPRGGDQAAIRAEAIRAYTTFLCGLLDLTDNISGGNEVVPPPATLIYDGHDPYLVVAADKGTATFSDIANGVAQSYGFWLGDAFASGGSVGYDHKVMGITARGAWEAVKRHFREIGKDIQAQDFTVAGIGDMSGDVFGNGMLLSKHICLVAAFDHRHIFLDPTPDAASAWEERDRLFKLPRSSWDDYDRTKLSTGGGIFPRSLKSIPLSPEIRATLDLTQDEATPDEVLNAILKARVELLYFGGVGCYVKARAESNAQAGDKANDSIRVNGADLRAQVVSEGANLAVTQAGRIEFAQAGGRLNTDAIDNSAGVDSSDHEVNIKILTGLLERDHGLTRDARNTLLASMTDEVAAHVLHHNYEQTLALSLLESEAASELASHAVFMDALEAEERLDRRVEGLPSRATIAERQKANIGLTRPELAVLLAYGKLDLKDDIVASDAPDDAFFDRTLRGYFPTPLEPHLAQMRQHRLNREIIATVLANDMVNMTGPSFPRRLRQAAACDTTALIKGFTAAREILGIDGFWADIASLDGQVPAAGQHALYRALAYALRSQTYWLARRNYATKGGVQNLIDDYGSAVTALSPLMSKLLSAFDLQEVDRRASRFASQGAPIALARAIAMLQPLTMTADLADLARAAAWPIEHVARLYHQAGEIFGFDKLRFAAGNFIGGDAFDRLAVRRLIEEMLGKQADITRAIMEFTASDQAGEDQATARAAVSSWASLHDSRVQSLRRVVDTIEQAGGGWSFAKLTIANAALRQLA
jgi:glutamate dehydrogenase